MPPLKNPKWEIFCQARITGKSIKDAALAAGLSYQYAVNLSHKSAVVNRYDTLMRMSASSSVMPFGERQVRLSKIARANLVDFVGQDGVPKLSPETPNHEAVSAYAVTTLGHDEVVTKTRIKLLDPIEAISELNKMDHVYDATSANQTTNNTQINIIVQSEATKELVSKILAGERAIGSSNTPTD